MHPTETGIFSAILATRINASCRLLRLFHVDIFGRTSHSARPGLHSTIAEAAGLEREPETKRRKTALLQSAARASISRISIGLQLLLRRKIDAAATLLS